MGSVGTRGIREQGLRRPLLLVLSIGALAIVLVLSVAGCGGGNSTTTTTTTIGQPDETTTTGLPGGLTTSTEAAVVETSTTSTSIIEETTTSSTVADQATTTTEKLSTAEQRLPNGHIKAMGFIKKVWEQGGTRYISIDYAEMLTGQTAIDAAIKDHVIQPGEDLPNDYYISNSNKELRQFEVSGSVAITTATWGEQAPNNPVTWDVFASFWSATPPDAGAAFLRDNPWWIERDGLIVIRIEEQYLP